MVNCTVCQYIEKVTCEHPSRHDPETNQHKYIFMPQNWYLEIVTSCTTSRKALRLIVWLPAIFNHSVRFLNMFKNLSATDFDREIVCDRVVRCFRDSLRLSRSTIHELVTMSFNAYVQLPGIFDCSVRRLSMLEDRRSPPHNHFCSCDCSHL